MSTTSITILAQLDMSVRSIDQVWDDSAALLASYLTEAGAPGIDELMASYQEEIDALDPYDDMYELDDIRHARDVMLNSIGAEYDIHTFADGYAEMYYIESHK